MYTTTTHNPVLLYTTAHLFLQKLQLTILVLSLILT